MTRHQKKLLDYLRRFAPGDIQPSISEMGQFLGVKGRGGVHRMLQLLQQEGLVEKFRDGERCWRATVVDRFAGFSDEDLAAELRRRGYTVDAWIRRSASTGHHGKIL